MLRALCLLVILTLGVAACDQADSPQSTSAPHQVVKETPPQPSPAKGPSGEGAKPAPPPPQPVQEEAAVNKPGDTVAPPPSAEKIVTEKVDEAPAQAAAPTAKGPEVASGPTEITLVASNGNVTFTHGKHAATFDCITCHSGTPAAFGIDKELAHTLCKGCHKESGAGPTTCRDCHVK